MSAVNETLIRDVVAEVLGKLGSAAAADVKPLPTPSAPPVALTPSCGCETRKSSAANVALRGKFGVFQDANEACAAAQEAYLQLKQKGIAARRKIEEIVKTLAEKNAEAWGKLEFDETKIGRLDHKIAKLKIIKLVPGVDWLRPDGRSGDHGITLEEYTPFGVVGAVTPSTHSIPTLSGNIVNICRRRQCVVFNRASGRRALRRRSPCAPTTRRFTAKPASKTSPASSKSRRWIRFNAICKNESVRLLLVTGGPMVVKAAMQTGKRAICAGPGNPPVFVDDTCCLTRAAKAIIAGAAL